MLQTGTRPMSPLGRGHRDPMGPGPPGPSPARLSSDCSPKKKKKRGERDRHSQVPTSGVSSSRRQRSGAANRIRRPDCYFNVVSSSPLELAFWGGLHNITHLPFKEISAGLQRQMQHAGQPMRIRQERSSTDTGMKVKIGLKTL